MIDAFQVHVEPAVYGVRRDYVALVLVASGLRNGPSDADSDAQLAAAQVAVRSRGLARAADHPHVASWRAAFSAFGAKPSRYPSSVEALMSRILKGQEVPRINVLVDLYNAVSIRHVVPVGGEDANRLDGTLRLVVAAGDELFDPRGEGSQLEPVDAGEVVWRDDRGVTCRRWNWRQGRRTQLTDSSTDAFFIFDRLDGLSLEDLHRAADSLADLLHGRWPDCQITRIERSMAGPDGA